MKNNNKYILRSKNVKKKIYIKNKLNLFSKIIPFSLKKKPSIVNSSPFGSNISNISLYDLFFNKILNNKINKLENIIDNPIKKFKFDINKKYTEINTEINTLEDLINLGKSYDKNLDYPIDMIKLNNLVKPLTELNNVIGMSSVKKNIINQIIYNLQDLDANRNMSHTVITGPPGVGKTMLGLILAKIYYNMGILKKQKSINPITGEKEDFKFNIIKRSDLIGEYVGHTAIKTQKVIDNSSGGVLFIDEAYSLGNSEKKDIFSKECIDTINQNLTEKKNELICIIAGYKDELEKCFFSYNEGLRRRFVFKYDIEKYNSKELMLIFIKKINDIEWICDIEKNDLNKFFSKNKDCFKYYGGDIELLIISCKISHSRRIFGKHPKLRKKLILEDIKNGFNLFFENKNKKKTEIINSMFL